MTPEQLMNCDNIQIKDIENLIKNKEKESLLLEYKSGDWIKKDSHSKFKLRKWVSAFANSAGGTLIIGISEKTIDGETYPNEIDGIDKTIFDKDIVKWVDDVLKDKIFPRLNPPPQISILHDENDEILIIIQIKQTNFFIHKVTELGKETYFHRHNIQVLQMDEWEIRTLLFGRTPPPILEPSIKKIAVRTRSHKNVIQSYIIIIDIENVGWRIAKYLQFGIIRPAVDLESKLNYGNSSSKLIKNKKEYLPDSLRYIFDIADNQGIISNTIALIEPNFLHPYNSIQISYELESNPKFPIYDEIYLALFILAENLRVPEIYEIKISDLGKEDNPKYELRQFNGQKIKILAHEE